MKILITRKIPHSGIKKLQDFSDQIFINQKDRNLTYRELCEKSSEVDAILTMLANNIDRKFIESCNNLKIIANYAVGYNNIDITAATENNIIVTNTPGVLTETTADLAWALIMAVMRRIVESDEYTRAGRFKGWAPELFCGTDIYGKTLGIVGCGRIGQATARRAAGFNMPILYYNRSKKEKFEEQTKAKKLGLEELLKRSDIVSLHLPLTDQTESLIDEQELDLMKETAFLINTARGPVVNESALVQALNSGSIAGAGLDVFEKEPQVHPGLVELTNVVLTPHIGSATTSTRAQMAQMAADNIIEALSGNKPANVVNPDVLK